MKNNLFDNIPGSFEDEIFETLHETPELLIERILSDGQATPPGEWLQQDRSEWVVLLQGRAGLKFDDQAETIKMSPGDYVLIPANRRHRVEWTDENEKTVWLALHF